MHGAYIVFGVGVASLLLSLVVWLDAHRTKQWARQVVEWQQAQPWTVEQGGMVIGIDVNRQPVEEPLRVITAQVVRGRGGSPPARSPNRN